MTFNFYLLTEEGCDARLFPRGDFVGSDRCFRLEASVLLFEYSQFLDDFCEVCDLSRLWEGPGIESYSS